MGIWLFFTLIYFAAANPLKALDSHFKLNFNNSLENYAIQCLLDFVNKVSPNLWDNCMDLERSKKSVESCGTLEMAYSQSLVLIQF